MGSGSGEGLNSAAIRDEQGAVAPTNEVVLPMNYSHLPAARFRARTYVPLLLLAVLGVALAPPSPAVGASSVTVKLAVGSAAPTGWWPDTYWVKAGSPVAAVVTGSEVRVELQKRTPLGLWQKVAVKTFTTPQTVRLAVPLDQRVTRPVKTQAWRITVQAGNYRNTMPQNFRLIGRPVASPTDALLARAVSLAETRWDRFNPCSPITWAMDVRRSPYGKLVTAQMVHYVINTLRAKTGLNFVFKGHVTHSGDPSVRSAYKLTIVWAKNSRAGAASVGHRWMRGSAFLGLTKGTAVISTANLRVAKTRIILFHEVMHVLGAGHSKSSADIMYPAAVGQRGFGAGDLAVLKQLDARNTCF